MARSTTFLSSRTLPGQEYCRSSSMASLETGTGSCWPDFFVKCSTSSGMSSTRSRNAGISTVTVFMRYSRSCRKAVFPYLIQKILVCGSNQAEIDLHLLYAADTKKSAGFQHAQQLHLEAGTELTNLIQKQGAAVGQFKQTRASTCRRW